MLLHVVGARPNFAKAASVIAACTARGLTQRLVHTGQHYDANMSQTFLEELGLPEPDVNLGVGSGSHAQQTAAIMVALESLFVREPPGLVIVYGDVNSTLAAALVCAKLCLPVAHVEAGLRSFDRSMPEEVNRVLTDQVATLLFTPSEEADANLAREGIEATRIHRVGNVMIDTLARLLPTALARPARFTGRYALMTLHRPSNVDDPQHLASVFEALGRIAERVPVVFPVHPRTRARLGAHSVPHGVLLVEPLGYLDFVRAEKEAALVITDSGGVQEETTWLGVPCLTLRETTERPITVTLGTNAVVGTDPRRLVQEAAAILDRPRKPPRSVPLWDGQAGARIADILATRKS